MGLKSQWGDAHVRLKRLYEQRAPSDMTQKEFGAKFGIGSQSMVAQYLGGNRPLNYEAAAKFARGLECTIYDISPDMADSIKEEILPYLGRALRRAAVLACFTLLPLQMWPAPSQASPNSLDRPPNCVLCQLFRTRLRRWLTAMAAIFGLSLTAACATIDEHTAPPADWPELSLHEHHVPHAQMRDQCARWTAWGSYPEACAVVNFELKRCDMWFSADFPPMRSWIEHEYMHCAGHDHVGNSQLSDGWKEYKASAAGKSISESVRKRTQEYK